jgi:hypothetical protein
VAGIRLAFSTAVRSFCSLFAVALVIGHGFGLAACSSPERQDGQSEEEGADEGNAGGSLLEFSGQFRLFNGIDSQEAELRGSFLLGTPSNGGADVRDVEYTLTLKGDSFHSAYTLASAEAEDRSFAEVRDSGIAFFIKQDSPLTEGALASVFDAAAGARVQFRFFPVCDAAFDACHPGTLSGFDFRPGIRDPFAELPLDQIGPFAITRADGDVSQD